MNKCDLVSRPRFILSTLAGVCIILLIALISQMQKPVTHSTSKNQIAYVKQVIAETPESTVYRTATAEHWHTVRGTPVYFLPVSSPEIADIQIDFHAGANMDDDKPGLSQLTGSLLGTSTRSKSEDNINALFEQTGSLFSISSSRERLTISLRTLAASKIRIPTLQLMIEVISQPTFNDNTFIREKNKQLNRIQSLAGNSVFNSMEAVKQRVFANTPYAQPQPGTEASLARIQLSDIRDFYQDFFSARNMTISLVGSISRSEAEQISEQISQAFPEGSLVAKTRSPEPLTQSVRKHLDVDSGQSTIMLATLGVPRTSNDYPALMLANEILGANSFGSILLGEIRERQGLAYSIYSAFRFFRNTGLFFILTQTRADQTQLTLDEIKRLLTDFVENGPTEKQLIAAKKQIAGSFPMEMTTNLELLATLAETAFYQLPDNERMAYIETIKQLTRGQIKEAFARVVNPETMVIITAGQLMNEKPDS